MPDLISELISRMEVLEEKAGVKPAPGFTAAEQPEQMPEEQKPFTSAVAATPAQQANVRVEEQKKGGK